MRGNVHNPEELGASCPLSLMLGRMRADVREFSGILLSHTDKLRADHVLPDYAPVLQEVMQGIMRMGTTRDAARSLIKIPSPPPWPPPQLALVNSRWLGRPAKKRRKDDVVTTYMAFAL